MTTASVQSHIAAISGGEFSMLAREAAFKASWQVSEHNADRLFGISDMFKGLARKQQSLIRPKRARRDSTIRSWRSWESKQ